MHLLFDLDGTLTDSRVGVTRCIQQALVELGVAPPPVDELRQYVGPPLPASFATLLQTSNIDRIENAIAAYRHRFERVGMFENVLYPGIAELLQDCAAAGHAMCVVTAKPHVYARRILHHFRIDALFRSVYGPELGARDYTKEFLIRLACTAEQAQAGRTIMIGDRAEDVRGAKSNGLHSIAVTWGYGDLAELEAAQPGRIVESADQLFACIQQAR